MLCAKYRKSEDEIRAVPPPEYTKSWHPISHAELLDMVQGQLQDFNFRIKKKEFAMDRGVNRMFGVLDLEPYDARMSGFSMSVGLRNSIDKSLSAAVCLGTRVFICDNLSFSGETILSQKHNPSIEQILPDMVTVALDEFKTRFLDQEVQIYDQWKTMHVNPYHAADTLLDMVDNNVLLLGAVPQIRNSFLHPEHEEFKDPTVWSFYNAITGIAKTRRATNPFDATTESMDQFRYFRNRYPVNFSKN